MNNPCKTCKSVAVIDNNPPCIVALIAQSRYFDGDPNGSTSTIEPRLFFCECILKNLHVSFSDISKFSNLFKVKDSLARLSPCELISFNTIFSTLSISVATRNALAPTPVNPSRKIFGLSNFFQNAEYAIIEKSLFNFALGLKNAGSVGGTLSVNERFGTLIFVFPSTISIISELILCN